MNNEFFNNEKYTFILIKLLFLIVLEWFFEKNSIHFKTHFDHLYSLNILCQCKVYFKNKILTRTISVFAYFNYNIYNSLNTCNNIVYFKRFI